MATTRMEDVKVPEGAEWLTLKQAAVYAGASYSRLTRAVREGYVPHGKLPYTKTNRGVRVSKRDLEEWVKGGCQA